MNFFGLSEDKLYYDERKKRFVNTKDAPGYVERAYKNSHFKDVSQSIACSRILICQIVTTRPVRSREARVPNQTQTGSATYKTNELPNKAWDEETLETARWSQLQLFLPPAWRLLLRTGCRQTSSPSYVDLGRFVENRKLHELALTPRLKVWTRHSDPTTDWPHKGRVEIARGRTRWVLPARATQA